MSEYVVEFDEASGGAAKREEIVRCRDCAHMFNWAYDRPLCKLWAMNGPDESEASSGNALYPVVRLDGFCSWGERK